MTSYGDFIREIRGGKIRPVYYLAGGDAFFEDLLIREAVKKFLPPDTRRLIFSLDDDRSERILEELSAYTLFSSRDVIVVRQIQRILGKARDELLAYCADPNPDKCLILITEEYQATRSLQKNIAKLVPVVDTRPPFPDKMASWTNYYAKLNERILEPAALDLLMNFAGDSVGHIASELDKLFIQVDPGGAVTAELVQAQVGADRTFKPWDLQAAVADRDTHGTLRVALSLLDHGTGATQVISLMTAVFAQLLYIQSRTTAERVYTGLNQHILRKLSGMTRRYAPKETAAALRRLLRADTRLKSSQVNQVDVLVPAIVEIVGQ